jgi:hypothetical protein
MKKLLAFLMITLLLYNTAGYYFVFCYNQFILRNEMKNLIKSSYFDKDCTIIKIANPKFNKDFIRLDNKEFRYKGILYDIISEESKDGVLIIRCVNDKQEDNLISELSRSQEFANGLSKSSSSKHSAALRYHIITLALLETPRFQPAQFPKVIKFQNSFYPLSFIINPPPSPPPKLS